jgi:hypothetical protein
MAARDTSKQLREVMAWLTGQTGGQRILGATGLPLLSRENEWHGWDLVDEDGTILRLAAEDPEAGMEVHVLDERGVLMTSAHFSSEARSSAIALYAQAAV